MILAHACLAAAFVALMLVAAFEDFRRLVIPNRITAALAALWLVYAPVSLELGAALASIGWAAGVLLVGAFLFARGFLGGGDVKLITVALLWTAPAAAPGLLALTAIIGGVIGLLLSTPVGAQLCFMIRLVIAPGEAADLAARKMTLPYGVAIAAAAVLVTAPPLFPASSAFSLAG